jgi:hypothetical protein
MKFMKGFSRFVFVYIFVFIFFLTLFSFFAAWARDEGTLGNNILLKVLADLYTLFRFPAHTLFWKYMNGNLFFIGLLVNCLLYSYIIERLIHRWIERSNQFAATRQKK